MTASEETRLSSIPLQQAERLGYHTVLKLSEGALSGSGFEIQGAHIFDPRTGAPATRWAQSWSRAASAAVADALSRRAERLASL